MSKECPKSKDCFVCSEKWKIPVKNDSGECELHLEENSIEKIVNKWRENLDILNARNHWNT